MGRRIGTIGVVGLLVTLLAAGGAGAEVEEGAWNGFMACGVVVFGEPISCFSAFDPAHDVAHDLVAGTGAWTVVVVLDWDPTLTHTANTLQLRVENLGSGGHGAVMGEPPLSYRLDFDEPLEEPLDLRLRVLPGGEANVVYQQPFEARYSIHYGEPAP